MLADFTLEAFPNVRIDDLSLLAVSFTGQPLLQATQTDKAHGPSALAW